MMLALGAAFLSQSTEYEPAIFSSVVRRDPGREHGSAVAGDRLGRDLRGAVGLLYRPLLLTSIAPEIAAARDFAPSDWRSSFWSSWRVPRP